MRIKAKDLIGMDQLDREQIGLILQTAKEMKTILKRDIKKVPTLRGKSVVTLFFEPSTRTRTSFELAAKYMSADLVNINTSVSSVVKGESLKDTENLGSDGCGYRRDPAQHGRCPAGSGRIPEGQGNQCGRRLSPASHPGFTGYDDHTGAFRGL